MRIALKQVKRNFDAADYARGLSYYRHGQVLDLTWADEGTFSQIACTVVGTERYSVRLRIFSGGGIQGSCTCPRYEQAGVCKHMAAAAIACAEREDAPAVSDRSDGQAAALLRTYLEQDRGEPPAERARLELSMDLRSRGMEYPSLTLRVGSDRLYVVKDIKAFLGHVHRRETVSYGKGLTLFHGVERFDEFSQRLIEILMDQFQEFRTFHSPSFFYYENYSTQRNQIVLTGKAFDRLFDLLRAQPDSGMLENRRLCFQEGDPAVSVRLRQEGGHARMEIRTSPELSFFGNKYSLYALEGDTLMRCGGPFHKEAFPLLSGRSRNMKLSLADLPVFFSCVLPRIREYVDVDVPEKMLEEYLPDECVPRFYFDMEADRLSAVLRYRYGAEELTSAAPADKTPGIKRDLPAEQAAARLLARYFEQEGGGYFLTGDDRIYTFLTETLDTFREQGEVFVSDRLSKKRIVPSRVSLGISVSNGQLLLELDTGEFPPEELEALYQSLLLRRRYHRLADGRYLGLDGSPYEKMAEAAHMLQLSAGDMEKGRVAMPAYRALYLDGLFADSEGISVDRDKNLRTMIRNFKSVAESDYVLPAGMEGVLRPYQQLGFRWMKTLESCGFGGILADEMGLGKTLQAIAFLASSSRRETGLTSLVVCPTSLILNWAEEFAKFAPALRVILIMGTAPQRRALLDDASEQDVLVTSYELLRQDIARYGEMKFYCCLLDEGQFIKNSATLASKAVKHIQCAQRFVLTGTPIENRLSELWNLFDFLMPGYLYTHSAFVSRLEKPIVKSKNGDAAQQLRRLVRPFLLRRLKRDVLKELPPKIEHVRRIPLSEEERRIYAACAAQARRTLGDGQTGKLQVLAALTRLRQLCCDPSLCIEDYKGVSSKLETCLELCASMTENGHQILLFSQFTSMLERIRLRLEKLGISSFTLQGSTTKEVRARQVKAFNAGGASVFLISLKAGGTGLNLTAADVVIHYDPWWNLAAQEQATDRTHRIGQRSHVHVYKLIAERTIEERILELQSRKGDLMDAFSGASEDGILSMSSEDLLSLLDEG